MKLNLEQAAKDSDLSCQDLLDYIEAGRLHAERKAIEDRTEYLIDAHELSRFMRELKPVRFFYNLTCKSKIPCQPQTSPYRVIYVAF